MPNPPHAARRDRLRAVLAARDLPAALVTGLPNVRYLTGFTGSNGALLVDSGGADLLLTDGRYVDQAAEQAPDVACERTRTLLTTAGQRLAERGRPRVGIETHRLTVDQHAALRAAAPGVDTPSLDRAVEALRQDKDDTEIAALRRACEISVAALADLLGQGLVGRTEREVARTLDDALVARGAECPGFATIVATGRNGALPHHEPAATPIAAGDLVTIDFGARVAGYHADCTRTVAAGHIGAPWQREVYDLVRAAQRAGRAALAAGAAAREVDAAARDVVTAAGYGERFTHGLGHGVGLEIHEDPYLGPTADGRIGSRAVVTVEPGVYLPGQGGVRIEDTVLVCGDAVEVLTPVTTELVVC